MLLIELQNIYKIYKMESESIFALKNVSLKINKEEFVSIMGPSGSGKSTLMNILGCLDLPTRGTYRLEGMLINQLKKHELAKIRNQKIGFVFQTFHLLQKYTSYENVELPLIYAKVPKKEREERVKYFLDLVGLSHRLYHYPYQLSGGQQQRVAIARALVNRPSLILADEPTGNLDSKTSYEILDLFQKLNQEDKVSIILITHERDIADFSKRIIMIKDGEIVKDKKLC
ncbi:MAG: ABC transporter ATP-binding protein [Leptonema sp. (in: bacteria)]